MGEHEYVISNRNVEDFEDESAVELLGDGSGGLLSGDEMRRVIYLFDEVRGVRLFDRIVFR